MEQVSPTRTELLNRKAQMRLARQGADLLRGKREALIREFFLEIRKFAHAREALMKSLLDSKHSLMQTLAVDGPEAVASTSLACQRLIEIETLERNIWGTRFVEVKTDYAPRPAAERPFGSAGSSVRMIETAENFENTLELILKTAPLDQKLRKLAEEIRKTSRRVNALEQRLLPSLDEQVHYIRGVLDQREREDVFRLKRLKKGRS
jgi:V/A-type H+/Na+-transporting ATPase subunit D